MPKTTKPPLFAEVIGKTLSGLKLVEGNTEEGCSVEVHFTDGTFVSVDLDPTVRGSATLMRTAANGDYETVRNTLG